VLTEPKFLQGNVVREGKTLQIQRMNCRDHERDDPHTDLFKVELATLLNLDHPMVRLADEFEWDQFKQALEAMWDNEKGRPAIDTRLMVSLHYLKYTFDLSDEDVVDGWVQNPYWQYLSGMRYFQHDSPLHPSSMSRWRGRAGQAGAEELLAQTIRTGVKMKAIKTSQLERVNVDTTVQEKHVRFPTDSRLYDRARERLVKAAQAENLILRQSYKRVGKRLLMQQGRYAHARQMKRAKRYQRKLRTILGRVIRDIERKSGGTVSDDLRGLLDISKRIHEQERHDKNKVYSVHAPEVECLSKGKAHKRYEFKVNVSVATTSKGGWHVGAMSCPGNPYDGHTLRVTMEQVKRLMGKEPKQAFVNQGYRGHNYEGSTEVHVDKKKRGKTSRRLWKWMKRRAAVEPGIGHLKSEHRMERNRLHGEQGDMFNAVLSAAGMNFHKLMRHFAGLLCHFWASWLDRWTGWFGPIYSRQHASVRFEPTTAPQT
jgi:transposase, IS5 family